MSKTFKDKPKTYRSDKEIIKDKPQRRFESTKGRKNIKDDLRSLVKGKINPEDYFI